MGARGCLERIGTGALGRPHGKINWLVDVRTILIQGRT
jgi:hypothetical protein